MGRACDIYEEEKKFMHSLVVKSDEKGNVGRPMRTRESNLKIHLQNIGWAEII